MLLAEVVRAVSDVAAEPGRTAKRDRLAQLLADAGTDELEPLVGVLVGLPRQGRIGVGWRTLVGIEAEPAAAPTLTVDDLDAALDRVAATTGPGSAGRRAELLRHLLGRATPPERDLVTRLMTGELRQGALDGVVAEAVARAEDVPATAVRRAHMLTGDLGETARLARTGGRAALDAVELRVGTPVRPMLASGSPSVTEALAELGRASVEWKLDGARIQVHRHGDDVLVATRNLNDVTDRLPDVVELLRSLPVRSAVLDGEILGLGPDERPRAFQDTMSRFGRDDPASWTSSLRPWFFDVLHLDGDDLLGAPQGERRARLEELVPDLVVPGVITDDPAEAEAVLDEALGRGHEGVVLKDAASPYAAGRRGKAWRKIKPVHTLDLVVLAAEWGHGRRRGWLSNLHLGARGDRGPVMVGKTFKGLTDELLTWQTEALLARETGRDGIVVHVRPELVVEIALDGVQSSTRYPGGVALRFARVRRYRDDKGADEADTIDTVRSLLP